MEAPGSGSTTDDYRFVMASTRQQRLFARSMELRLGEYLETYDNERMMAVEEAYRTGDIERVSVCARVRFCDAVILVSTWWSGLFRGSAACGSPCFSGGGGGGGSSRCTVRVSNKVVYIARRLFCCV